MFNDCSSSYVEGVSTIGNTLPSDIVEALQSFRSDDADAVVPQHNWRQGPDFRSGSVPGAGYACIGSNRPKLGRFGGDAPTSNPTPKPGEAMEVSGAFYNDDASGPSFREDAGVGRLLRNTEQIVPQHASKKTKKRLKAAAKEGKEAAFRWT